MLSVMQEEMFYEYVESICEQEEVDSMTHEYCDETLGWDVYLVELTSGKEYYLIADHAPLALLAKGGIVASCEDAIETYQSIE